MGALHSQQGAAPTSACDLQPCDQEVSRSKKSSGLFRCLNERGSSFSAASSTGSTNMPPIVVDTNRGQLDKNPASSSASSTCSTNYAPIIVDTNRGLLDKTFGSQMSVHATCGLARSPHSSLANNKINESTVLLTAEDSQLPFLLTKKIGCGGSGDVYLASWEGRDIAVKVIKGLQSPVPMSLGKRNPKLQEMAVKVAARDDAQRIERMVQLEAVLTAMLDHPNIIEGYKVLASYGAQQENKVGTYHFCIIMEYAEKGTLWDHLVDGHMHELSSDNEGACSAISDSAKSFVDSSLRCTVPRVGANKKQVYSKTCGGMELKAVLWDAWAALESLKEVVRALAYMHKHDILHGDFKACNVLLRTSSKDRRGYVCKVTDFGFSRILMPEGQVNTATFATVTHMPPELLRMGILTKQADMYSIGIMMWEMYSAYAVHHELDDNDVVFKVVHEELRPHFNEACPERYHKLAEQCWSSNPVDRPSVDQLEAELEAIQNELCTQGPNSPFIPALKSYIC